MLQNSSTYSEFSYYSPIDDSVVVRLSMSDSYGGEHFATIPQLPVGSSMRELRERALLAIEASVEAGLPPGEVKVPKAIGERSEVVHG